MNHRGIAHAHISQSSASLGRCNFPLFNFSNHDFRVHCPLSLPYSCSPPYLPIIPLVADLARSSTSMSLPVLLHPPQSDNPSSPIIAQSSSSYPLLSFIIAHSRASTSSILSSKRRARLHFSRRPAWRVMHHRLAEPRSSSCPGEQSNVYGPF